MIEKHGRKFASWAEVRRWENNATLKIHDAWLLGMNQQGRTLSEAIDYWLEQEALEESRKESRNE